MVLKKNIGNVKIIDSFGDLERMAISDYGLIDGTVHRKVLPEKDEIDGIEHRTFTLSLEGDYIFRNQFKKKNSLKPVAMVGFFLDSGLEGAREYERLFYGEEEYGK